MGLFFYDRHIIEGWTFSNKYLHVWCLLQLNKNFKKIQDEFGKMVYKIDLYSTREKVKLKSWTVIY